MENNLENNIVPYDLPVDFIADDDVEGGILRFYTHFPCKIKAGIYAVCMQGEAQVQLNLKQVTVKKNDFAVIAPGTFMKINDVTPDIRLAFLGVSSGFIEKENIWKYMSGYLTIVLNHPVMRLEPEVASFLIDAISLIKKAAASSLLIMDKEIVTNIMTMFHKSISNVYLEKFTQGVSGQKRENEIVDEFIKLAFMHYQTEHKASFYADQIGLTLSHFCATVKKVTGKTVQEIIRNLIVMDAKAQLKGGTERINKIAASLGFSASAFNRYFSEHVQMTPLDYRNS